jgi:hypothetical protein
MTAGRNTSANTGLVPRVFISYARSDGEQFAAQLRQWLQAEQIPLWQDRIGMEGGSRLKTRSMLSSFWCW